MIHICPVCRSEYKAIPALSRRDGVGEICPSCGIREALVDAGITGFVVEEIVEMNIEQMKTVET